MLAFAISSAWAGTFNWTGEVDNYWNKTGNWSKSGIYGSRTLPTNDDMVFDRTHFNERFKENEVVFDGAYKNDYRAYINNVGTAENPFVFRATDVSHGFQFANSKHTYFANSSEMYLKLKSGKWSSGAGNVEVGSSNPGWLAVTDGAELVVGNHIHLKNGKLILENGTVDIPNKEKYFSLGASADGSALILEEGGVLKTQLVWDGNGGRSSAVVFNGGTLKANGVFNSAWPAIIADKQNISVKVGAKGGTIDASGFDIQIARPFVPDGENDGGMTFKGGGSVTLKYASTYVGETKIAARTKLVVSGAELARLLANGGIKVIKPEGVSAKGTFKLIDKNDGACTAAECALITKDAGFESAIFGIDEDGDITVTVSHTPQTWAGAAETSAPWSGDNWDKGVAFDDGNDAIFATDGAIAEVDGNFSAYTLSFNDNAMLTGAGTLAVPTITVAEGKTASIAGPLAGAMEKTGAGTLALGSSRAGTTTTLAEGKLVMTAPVGTLVLGTDAAKPVTFDYGGQKYSASFTLNNGLDVTLTNCIFSAFSRVANGTVHVAKDATAHISNWITVGPASHRSDTVAFLDICGGVVSNSNQVGIGDRGYIGSAAAIRVSNGGLLATDMGVIVGTRAAATLTIDDGSVNASRDILFCQYSDCEATEDCFLNLNAGGVLTARSVIYDNGAANATFTFNGGTLRANQDKSPFIENHDRLSVVTAGTGAIDAAGHAITIAKAISGAGGMVYKGGGKVTFTEQPAYAGVTTVEIGTTLVVPSAIAGGKLAFTVPDDLADGVYTVVSISGDTQFSDDVLSGKVEGFVLSADKKRVCYVKGMDKTKPIYIGEDGNLSAAGNWLDGTVPTGGIGEAQIFCASASTLTVGDTFAPAKLIISADSALVTIGSGTLCAGEIANMHLLAVGSGATVAVSNAVLGRGEFLCDHNNGTLVVSNLLLKAESGDRHITKNQQPSALGVFKFNAVTNMMTDNWFFMTDYAAVVTNEFHIGAEGLGFLNASGTSGYCFGRNANGDSVTKIRPWYDDFTIADRGIGSRSLILQHEMIFCTDDESGEGRTITIDANTRGQRTPVITVSGKGKMQVNGTYENSAEPQIFVTDTATLAFGEGASLGTGAITLGNDTKLALTRFSDSSTFTPIENIINLPTDGKATVCIDGERLRAGKYEIFAVGTGTAANAGLDDKSGVLAGRRGWFEVEGGMLVLNIESDGTMLIVR